MPFFSANSHFLFFLLAVYDRSVINGTSPINLVASVPVAFQHVYLCTKPETLVAHSIIPSDTTRIGAYLPIFYHFSTKTMCAVSPQETKDDRDLLPSLLRTSMP